LLAPSFPLELLFTLHVHRKALVELKFNQRPIFEWYTARLVVKNGHKKQCYNEIGQCAQNLVSFIGRVYVMIMERDNFHFDLL
jgi:hypothetical protein